MSSLSATPKTNIPPEPFANALTVFSQLLGFLVSTACFLSYSVASPNNYVIFII